MKKTQHIINLRFKNYVSEITAKRLKFLMPVAIIILLLLIVSDIVIRHSYWAVLTRLIPLSVASFLIIYNKIHSKNTPVKTLLYNIFLSSIPAMMFAKYLIHFSEGNHSTAIIGIILAIFIISLEVRADLINSILIYIIPPILFLSILICYYALSSEEWESLINIIIVLIAGFSINLVQNNFRFKTYVSNYLLNVQKKKLEESNKSLNHYKNKLEDMVEKKTITLKYALEKAKESDALKTHFLRNISHELRTPMNAVLGFNDIVTKKNPELKREYDIIESNLNLLLKTIENIILLSQLQSDQIGSNLSKFSLNAFNKTIFEKLKSDVKVSKKSISAEFKNQFLNNDLIMNSDYQKLEIIFKHIFDNAVKYTETGKIKLSCKLISENKIQYIVSDTGIGISSDELPHIFDTFRKAEKKEKLFGGTGIGLSIAKQLTELLNGKISVSSNQNKGTTIKIIFKIPESH